MPQPEKPHPLDIVKFLSENGHKPRFDSQADKKRYDKTNFTELVSTDGMPQPKAETYISIDSDVLKPEKTIHKKRTRTKAAIALILAGIAGFVAGRSQSGENSKDVSTQSTTATATDANAKAEAHSPIDVTKEILRPFSNKGIDLVLDNTTRGELIEAGIHWDGDSIIISSFEVKKITFDTLPSFLEEDQLPKESTKTVFQIDKDVTNITIQKNNEGIHKMRISYEHPHLKCNAIKIYWLLPHGPLIPISHRQYFYDRNR
ncbi:MAG: hypothetical protein KBD00_05470 [Candidatus Peribacteraceae bacterium]|nr:hypothetical protein [Candidatus Peribacteraceae bacterium]